MPNMGRHAAATASRLSTARATGGLLDRAVRRRDPVHEFWAWAISCCSATSPSACSHHARTVPSRSCTSDCSEPIACARRASSGSSAPFASSAAASEPWRASSAAGAAGRAARAGRRRAAGRLRGDGGLVRLAYTTHPINITNSPAYSYASPTPPQQSTSHNKRRTVKPLQRNPPKKNKRNNC